VARNPEIKDITIKTNIIFRPPVSHNCVKHFVIKKITKKDTIVHAMENCR
jgi:hypothetical protein